MVKLGPVSVIFQLCNLTSKHYPLRSSPTTTMSTHLHSRLLFSLTLANTLRWALNCTNLHPESKQLTSSRIGWGTHWKRLSLHWPRQRTIWHGITTDISPQHLCSLPAIGSTLIPLTSRPPSLQESCCTATWGLTQFTACQKVCLTLDSSAIDEVSSSGL